MEWSIKGSLSSIGCGNMFRDGKRKKHDRIKDNEWFRGGCKSPVKKNKFKSR